MLTALDAAQRLREMAKEMYYLASFANMPTESEQRACRELLADTAWLEEENGQG